MDERAPVRVEELLAHAGWVRGLAASLVRDPGAADDLVQETWVAAMEGPPEGGRPLRPWLAGVLRNLWRERLRGEGRRRAREGAAARPGRQGFPSPDELAARLETARRLAALVAGLEEPFRATVLLRFYEGVPSAEIARRTGVPDGTVRWRLHRALADLRARLDAESGGDRRAWLAAVAPLATGVAPAPASGTGGAGGGGGAAAAATGGILAMATATKATVAVAAVVVVAAGLAWLALPSRAPEGPPPGAPRESATAAGRVVAVPPTPAGERGPEPAPAAAGTGEVALNEHGVPRDPVPRVIAGRVVTEEGAPIPAAVLAARFLESEVAGRSGEDGTFRIDLVLPTGTGNGWSRTPGHPLTFALALVATARARVPEVRSLEFRLGEGSTMSLGDIVLPPGGSVSGRVVDAAGAPVPGAWIGVEDTDAAAAPVEDRRMWERESLVVGVPALSDGTGAFLLEGAPVGALRLWAGKARHRAGRSALVEVRAGAEESGVEIRIEAERAEDRIEGRVLAPDGSPVRNAWFFGQADGEGRSNTIQVNREPEAGRDGSFSLAVHFPADFYILAQDSYGRWGATFAGPIRPGNRSVEMKFPEARKVTLRVRSRAGEPVTSFRADLGHATVRFGYRFRGVQPGDHPGGEAEFLAPGFPFHAEVTAEGFAKARIGPFDPASLPATLDCVLEPVAAARGRVTAGSAPVAGARVVALRAVPAGSKCVCDDLPCRWYPDAEAETPATPASGEFALPLRDRGGFVLRAEAEGFAPAEVGPLDFDPARGVEGIEIPLGRGGTLEGRVLLPPGRSPEGTIVVVHRGDGRPRSLRVGPDGRFRFEALTPGPWILARHDREVPARYMTSYSPGTSEFPWNFTVEEGRTTARDLDLADAGGPSLRGRFVPGAPAEAPGWTAALVPAGAPFGIPVAGPVTLGAEGVFALAPPRAGTWIARLVAPDGNLRVFDSVEVAGTDSPWTLDLAFGRVEGVLAAGTPAALLWQGEGERWALVEVRPDAEGRFEVLAMPAGRLRLLRLDPAAPPRDLDPRRGPPEREFEVPAGGTATLR